MQSSADVPSASEVPERGERTGEEEEGSLKIPALTFILKICQGERLSSILAAFTPLWL